jgi:hypothetical protein
LAEVHPGALATGPYRIEEEEEELSVFVYKVPSDTLLMKRSVYLPVPGEKKTVTKLTFSFYWELAYASQLDF